MDKNVLSCIQPTGDLHLGNYFGAVKNYVDLQSDYNCFYGVVDYHSLTMPYNPSKLREDTWKMAFQMIACGVDENNVFVQSLIPEHTELSWILACICAYGDTTRMTQFKDKSDQLKTKDKDAFVSTGLFMYPILQAADILIYRADFVPVGKDQEQHLELTRTVAARFNRQFKKEYFPIPRPLFTETPKIMSTADPSKKMSKSLGEKHFINLFGEESRVRKQVRSAVTDTGETKAGEMSNGVANLFELLKAAGNTDAYNSLMDDYKLNSLKYSDLKEIVGNTLVELTSVKRAKLQALNEDKKAVKEKIIASSAIIRERAQQTLKDVREITGLLNLRAS